MSWWIFLIMGRAFIAKAPRPSFFGRLMARLHGVKVYGGPYASAEEAARNLAR